MIKKKQPAKKASKGPYKPKRAENNSKANKIIPSKHEQGKTQQQGQANAQTAKADSDPNFPPLGSGTEEATNATQ